MVDENLFVKKMIIEDYSLNSKFGKYKCATKIKGDKVIYSRYIEMNSGRYPAAEYDSFINFFEQIKQKDQPMAILNQINR